MNQFCSFEVFGEHTQKKIHTVEIFVQIYVNFYFHDF